MAASRSTSRNTTSRTQLRRRRNADARIGTSVFGSVGARPLHVQGAYGSRARSYVPTGAYGTTLRRRPQPDDRLARLDRRDGHGRVQGRGADRPGLRRLQRLSRHLRLPRGDASSDSADGVLDWASRARRRSGSASVTSVTTRRRVSAQRAARTSDSCDVDPFLRTSTSHYRSNQAAIYVQDEIELHRRLTATVGGRYDWWSLTGGTATPAGRPRLPHRRRHGDQGCSTARPTGRRRSTRPITIPIPSSACCAPSGCARPKWSTSSTSAAPCASPPPATSPRRAT